MKYLFIGGSADGERLEADGGLHWDVPVHRKTFGISELGINAFIGMEFETYSRCRLADLDNCDRIEHIVYRYKDDNVKPLDKLIQGYAKRYTPKNEKE